MVGEGENKMPGYNGFGPQGLGPMTGRGVGQCGKGINRGFGRCFNGGFANQLFLSKEEQKKILEEELKAIDEEKKVIEFRLKEIEG